MRDLVIINGRDYQTVGDANCFDSGTPMPRTDACNRQCPRPRNPRIRLVTCSHIGGHYNRLRRHICRGLKKTRPRDVILLYCKPDDLSQKQRKRLQRTIRETGWTYERGYNDL